jgi:hypothetical protein
MTRTQVLYERVTAYIKSQAGDYLTDDQCVAAAKFIISKTPKPSPWYHSKDRCAQLQYEGCKRTVKQIWKLFVTPIEGNSSGFTQEALDKL